jgi:fibronectin-binding autotransporter adhesin
MRSTHKSSRVLSCAITAVIVAGAASTAHAADYAWVPLGGGTLNWDNAANWSGGGFPNAITDGADLSGAHTANLNVVVPAAGITVGKLTLGGTGSGVVTDIGNANATGGRLILNNAGSNLITSVGSASSTNIISAPIQIDAGSGAFPGLAVDIDILATSTRSLSINGDIYLNNADRGLRNRLGAGQTLTLGASAATPSKVYLYDVTTPLTSRSFSLTSDASATTVVNTLFVRGDGTTTGNGGLIYFGDNAANVTATYVMNVSQTTNAAVRIGKQKYILAADNAFGTGTLTAASNNNTSWGLQLQSTDDARVLPNNINNGNSFAVTGSNSLTLSGTIGIGSNNRPVGNALPAGKTLTLNGQINMDNGTTGRTFAFDGTGMTIVNGKMSNSSNDPSGITVSNIEKRGAGTLVLTNSLNETRGVTNVYGGLLRFDANGSWGNTGQANPGIVTFANGSIWYTPGSADANYATFLGEIVNTSVGAFAIPAGEAGTNFDFSSGVLASNAPSMSIGAQGAVTYTGTITAGASGYNLGSMMGTLTMPGNDRLVGANAVTYRNGGTVVVSGTQSYTGVTSITGSNMERTNQTAVAAGTQVSTSTFAPIFTPTQLDVSSVQNGGVNSGLGASSSAATNLVINGGVLNYVGAGSTSDRLFTIGQSGATISSNGTGSLKLLGTGAAVTAGTGARTLVLAGANTADNTIAVALANGAVATDALAIRKTGAGTWNLTGSNTFTGGISIDAGRLGVKRVGSNGNVTVAAGATLQVGVGGTGPSDTTTTSLIGETANTLTLATGASLDVTKSGVVFDYDVNSPEASIRAMIISGNAGGAGIVSSSIASNPGHAIGYATGAEATALGGTLLGQAFDATSVLVRYTRNGDATLDGAVNFDDLLKLAASYNTSGKWVSGDFNYDGSVNFDDLLLLAANYNQTATGTFGGDWSLAQAAVPEPTSLIAIGATGAMSLRRRRR